MADPRTSSGKTLPGFPVRTESQRTTPSGQTTESGSTGHRVGSGRDGSTNNQQLQEQSKQRFLADLEWAQKALPGEHGPFAAVARSMERMARRREPTADEVLARLKRTGRDRRAIDEQARRVNQRKASESQGGASARCPKCGEWPMRGNPHRCLTLPLEVAS